MPDQSTGTSKVRRWPAKYSATWASAEPRCPSAGPGGPPAGSDGARAGSGGPKRTLASPAAVQATDISPTGDPSEPQASSLTATLLTSSLSPAAPTVRGMTGPGGRRGPAGCAAGGAAARALT